MPLSANVLAAPIAHKADGADPYAWLQERDSAPVLDYLKAENRYQDAQLADQAELRETLFEEIKARIRETDLSLPSPWGPYLYYTRTTAGDEYARHYRCPRPADDSLQVDESQEQLLLDPNVLANGGFSLWAPSASARTTSVWPIAWTPAAKKPTPCSSRNCPTANSVNCRSRTATAA